MTSGGAVRFRLAQAPADLDALLFEALAGIPCSWTSDGGALNVWAAEGDAAAARQALLGAGLPVESEEVEPERDWVAASADLRTPVAVGRYLLDPHDGERASDPGCGVWRHRGDRLRQVSGDPSTRRRLFIPATRAFGTGSHESTRLALRLLQELPLAGARVLDAGCGAGTLSFVAALEGAHEVVAFDLDPDAAFATAALAHENGVPGVRAFAGPLEALSAAARFDVAVANMVQEEVGPLLSGLARRLAGGGVLVTSGQLVAREAEWLELLRARGFAPERLAVENEWLSTLSRVP